MKLRISERVSAIFCINAFVLISGMGVILCVGCDKQNDLNVREEDECATVVDVAVEGIKSNMWIRTGDMEFLKLFDERINVLSGDSASRRSAHETLAKKFLSMDVDVAEFVKRRSTGDKFILFTREVGFMMWRNGVDESKRIDFFFKALEKYKDICLSSCKDEFASYRDWLAWDASFRWLRDSMKNNLRLVHRDLFDSYLLGVSDNKKPDTRRRFTDFYVSTTQEIVRVEMSSKIRQRRPPPIRFLK